MIERSTESVYMAEQFKRRTKVFAIDIIKLYRTIPKTMEAQIIARQLIRSSTSIAANYRAACRARSKAVFFAKMCIVVEETDESLLWLELLVETDITSAKNIQCLKREINELLSVFSKARRTAQTG